MTRFSGIQVLAASVVLWALASWIFGAPHSAETETETAPVTETTAQAPGEMAEDPGAGANESAGAASTAVPASATPEEDPEAGRSPSRATSERTGTETASAPSPAGSPPIPPTETRAPPAVTGVGPVASSPSTGDDSGTERPWGGTGRPDAPPASAPPSPWFEHPRSRPPPPPGYSVADDDAVASQIDAARRAAWEGRLAESLAHYRAAARLRPKYYVVWGEMGNVLWTMRRWPEAAYALEGAATLLVRAGELRAASELVPTVGRTDPDAAYRVQRLLWAAAQSRPE